MSIPYEFEKGSGGAHDKKHISLWPRTSRRSMMFHSEMVAGGCWCPKPCQKTASLVVCCRCRVCPKNQSIKFMCWSAAIWWIAQLGSIWSMVCRFRWCLSTLKHSCMDGCFWKPNPKYDWERHVLLLLEGRPHHSTDSSTWWVGCRSCRNERFVMVSPLS